RQRSKRSPGVEETRRRSTELVVRIPKPIHRMRVRKSVGCWPAGKSVQSRKILMARAAAHTASKETPSSQSIAAPSREDFEAMLEASFEERAPAEGTVIRGTIVAIENDFAIVDVGLKTEGRVSLKEFTMPGIAPRVNIGDEVEVYLERIENALGDAVLS